LVRSPAYAAVVVIPRRAFPLVLKAKRRRRHGNTHEATSEKERNRFGNAQEQALSHVRWRTVPITPPCHPAHYLEKEPPS
jgi:hypothetical protein